jgi:ABC-type sulfate transport system substrate-binding protein
VVDANVDRKKTRAVAEAYLKYLYTDAGQEIIAKHFYRPINDAVLKKHSADFPTIKLFSVKEIAANWTDAHKKYIGDGGVFDGIYKPKK